MLSDHNTEYLMAPNLKTLEVLLYHERLLPLSSTGHNPSRDNAVYEELPVVERIQRVPPPLTSAGVLSRKW